MQDWVAIHGLELECIVGIRPPERKLPQRVRLDLHLERDLSTAGRSGRITQTTDYSEVARQVEALLRFRRYALIESAAEELAAALLGMHAAVTALKVRIEKPGALEGTARTVSVSIARRPEDFPMRTSAESFGARKTLLETREAVLEVVTLRPGATALSGAEPAAARVLLWPVSGSVRAGDRILAGHAPTVLDADRVGVSLEAGGSEAAVVFRCCRKLASGGSGLDGP